MVCVSVRVVAGMKVERVPGASHWLVHEHPERVIRSLHQLLQVQPRWLQDQPREHAVAILSERLARAEHLRRMLNDSDWDVCVDTRERARMLISYLQQVDDLIPDDQPLVGHLDDALLVELAWPMVAEELEDFRDFCRFRDESGAHFNGHPGRDDWLATRMEEGALWEQLHRVRSHHYVEYGPREGGLRVV